MSYYLVYDCDDQEYVDGIIRCNKKDAESAIEELEQMRGGTYVAVKVRV